MKGDVSPVVEFLIGQLGRNVPIAARRTAIEALAHGTAWEIDCVVASAVTCPRDEVLGDVAAVLAAGLSMPGVAGEIRRDLVYHYMRDTRPHVRVVAARAFRWHHRNAGTLYIAVKHYKNLQVIGETDVEVLDEFQEAQEALADMDGVDKERRKS